MEPEPDALKQKKEDNQKFGLVVGLLEADDWDSASALLHKLGRTDPASNLSVR